MWPGVPLPGTYSQDLNGRGGIHHCTVGHTVSDWRPQNTSFQSLRDPGRFGFCDLMSQHSRHGLAMDLVDLATRYMHVWKGVLDALGDENVTRMALRSVGSVALRDETCCR